MLTTVNECNHNLKALWSRATYCGQCEQAPIHNYQCLWEKAAVSLLPQWVSESSKLKSR